MSKRAPRTTALTPFHSCNPQGEPLFSVRAGIAPIDALEAASCLMSAARDVVNAEVS